MIHRGLVSNQKIELWKIIWRKKSRRKNLLLYSYTLCRLKTSGNKSHTHLKWLFPGMMLDQPEATHLNGYLVILICLPMFAEMFKFMIAAWILTFTENLIKRVYFYCEILMMMFLYIFKICFSRECCVCGNILVKFPIFVPEIGK